MKFINNKHKKMKRHYFLIALAMAVACGTASASELTLSGSGTADSPYQVGSATDWNALATYIADNADPLSGKYVQLTADIDFTGDTILALSYDRTTLFDGDLDGNSKTIKGFSVVSDASYFGGIVAKTGTSAVIHDLTVEGTITTATTYTGGVVGELGGSMQNVVGNLTITATANYCGGLVGLADATASLTDCVNRGTVTGSGNRTYMSGVVAQASGGATFTRCGNEGTVTSAGTYTSGVVGRALLKCVFSQCYNKGTVCYTGTTALSYTSGVVGYSYPGTYTGCYNAGTVQTETTSVGGCAGLIANAYSASSTTTSFSISGCYNSGDVTSGFNNGGLILTGESYTMLEMDSCYNSGNVTSSYTSTKTSVFTGGLLAAFMRNSTYTNCWNSGKVSSAGTNYVAGLFAYPKSSATSSTPIYVTNCYNTGEVSGSSLYVGGIFGYLGASTYLDSCYNTGKVSANYYCGGIAGVIYGPIYIYNCWNAGEITVASSRAGGIAGSTMSYPRIYRCFNVGAITSESTTQGTTDGTSGCSIGGIMGIGSGEIFDCYNAGPVTGASRVGGIIGAAYKSSTYCLSIERGYNTGKISAKADTCGNIMGSSVYNGSAWSTYSILSDTYYLTANNAMGDYTYKDTASVGLTYAELATLSIGENWTAGDNYTYPRLATLADNDYAKAYAAAVIPADGDSYSSITTSFNVGTPDGVTWTASSGSVEIDGNNVTFSESFSGTLTMTATSGNVSVATELTCNVVVSGISGVSGASREVVSEKFYTISGSQVAEPADGQKAIYIVVKTYDDGSTAITKEVK